MHDSAIGIEPVGLSLVVLAPLRNAVRPIAGLDKLSVKRVPRAVPGRKRVPIDLWQDHCWTKKIVAGEVRPSRAKIRVLRLGDR